MNFNKTGRLAESLVTGLGHWGGLLLVTAAGLGVASLLTACNQISGTLTVDFVYVTSAKAAGPDNYGEVDVFEINSESGRMRQIPTSPFPSGGRNPVAEAVAADKSTLYVVNRDDNTIVQFTIGNDGKLYPQNTVNTPGIFPMATAVSGKNLFVADTFEPLPTCSPAAPCSGSVAGWPIKADNSLDTDHPYVNASISASYWPLTVPGSSDVITPTAMTATASNLFVTAYDATANTGYMFTFTIGSGALSPLNGGVPTPAGKHPSSIVVDPAGAFVYITDLSSNDVLAFSVTSSGLTPAGSPAKTGNQPAAMVIDATGKLAYVANSEDSTISAYHVLNGTLTPITTAPVDTQPVAIGIDPAKNQFLFTANFLGNTVSGFEIDANMGTVLDSQFSPYAANANPTAVAAIPHGAVAK
ncbi:MAG TPA: beta-propeller fold lactonase family protein [Terracidiphilus sp.]|nr:beta-propeller fold lactonase family protein [Terracidiphilus sp.]